VDELLERLWDGSPPSIDRAAKTLRMTVARLRQALGSATGSRMASSQLVRELEEDQTVRRLVHVGQCEHALAWW
jgi:hypothetical protein